VEEKLRAIIAKIAETTPDFDANAHLRDDLLVDSIRGMEVVFEIEKTFGIKVPEDRYDSVATFADILALVKDLGGK
jgi:acyl carrier protein